jgi:glycerate kinase
MGIVIAPDKFKGSLTAPEVARHLAAGLRPTAAGVPVVTLPVSDGGDGFLDAMVAAGYRRVPVAAEGPTGQSLRASYAELDGVAVVELAETAGLTRLPGGQPAPLTASSYGTGQVMRAALEAGCRTLVVGLGGSACTDGGAGMLEALGARLADRDGTPVRRGGAALCDLQSVDLSGLHPGLTRTEVVVAADVNNPLTGRQGAAAVYGPQKGASPREVAELDRALAHWAGLVAPSAGASVVEAPGSGAAGGAGFALMALLGGSLRPGIDLVLELTGFAEKLREARMVITGEGTLDGQTLNGKAPAGVAAAARKASVPVIAVAGHSTLNQHQLHSLGILAAYALTDIEPDRQRCISHAGPLLERLGARLASEWLSSGRHNRPIPGVAPRRRMDG